MLPIKLKCQSGNGRHTKDSGKCRSYCSKENCQKQRYASKGIKNASDSLGRVHMQSNMGSNPV